MNENLRDWMPPYPNAATTTKYYTLHFPYCSADNYQHSTEISAILGKHNIHSSIESVTGGTFSSWQTVTVIYVKVGRTPGAPH